MALFAEQDDSETAARKRWGKGWIFLFVALLLGIILGSVPSPYVIEQPGPVFNTLGTTEHDGHQVPLISIPGQKTYPTSGTLDLLTVSAVGSPKHLPNWFQVVRAWFDAKKAVLPVDRLYPGTETTEERNAVNQELMVNSQQEAIAAAFTSLGTDYTATLTILKVVDDSPAAAVLEAKDVVTSLNGTEVDSLEELRAAITANGTKKQALVGIRRDGRPMSVDVTPTSSKAGPVLGVQVATDYTFPFDVQIQLDNVGGPSAGMMFALGIIDKLTPGKLNGGDKVAGTGTINAAGLVGEIGGIQQKMYAARDAGADWFLAPSNNCDDVSGHVPNGLQVFAVATLNDSLTALEAIRTGEGMSTLPNCSASR